MLYKLSGRFLYMYWMQFIDVLKLENRNDKYISYLCYIEQNCM